ncbi:Inner membrane protein YrbG, predicted calcium/sodium:proton antiporter [hydrothermal vent metagenome]|uniref:Inner membrane protein YrbG, predicted calcium/sodium:proton antiporter n=1 Tax=hydrothermal vent metagenome TaxID=652676 RepID=A0A3B0X4K9_9ZZZZ
MLINFAAVIAGFILLIWSADRFIVGAAATARNFDVPPLIIGLTIVGFGTSAPEMMVAGFASYSGSPALAIGNALGSNITNITLVLGVAALITPLSVHSRIIKKELPLLLFATLLALTLMHDMNLSRFDGFILLSLLFLLMWWITRAGLRNPSDDALNNEYIEELPNKMSISHALFWLIAGLILLTISSRILVWGAVNIAIEFGVSELVIGLTIIAIGTSLPELAASITGALKNEHDIAIGNVVGSNLFNTLGVLAIPALISPATFQQDILHRDLPIVFVLTISLFIMAYGFRGEGRINRVEGGLLLGAFIAYQMLLFFSIRV